MDILVNKAKPDGLAAVQLNSLQGALAPLQKTNLNQSCLVFCGDHFEFYIARPGLENLRELRSSQKNKKYIFLGRSDRSPLGQRKVGVLSSCTGSQEPLQRTK